MLLGAPVIYDPFSGRNPLGYFSQCDKAAYVLARTSANSPITGNASNAANDVNADSGAAQLITIAWSGAVAMGVGAKEVAVVAKLLASNSSSVADAMDPGLRSKYR